MFASKDTLLTRPSGYNIARSVRLRSSASAYFNRTPAGAGNRKTWTWSGWVKRGSIGVDRCLFSSDVGTSNSTFLEFGFDGGSDTISILSYTGDSNTTVAVFRDPSAWYHVVVAFDSTQATAANRCKIYVNGTQQTLTGTGFTLNADYGINNAQAHAIGYRNWSTPGRYFDGYLTEINFIDGQALTPSSFGETDSITGVWKPKAYSGTYGTNGFELNFSDNSNNTAATIGKDYSGNGNNWTPNNISVTSGVTYDSMVDSPTVGATSSNYCVLNPLQASAPALVDGNLNTPSLSAQTVYGTISSKSGKWYWEGKCTARATGVTYVGVENNTYFLSNQAWSTSVFAMQSNSQKYLAGTVTSYGSGFAAGNTIGVALDVTNDTLEFFVNGTSQGQITSVGMAQNNMRPMFQGNTATWEVNFGQRPFSYTPPTGYVALNTYNLPASTIKNGSAYMAATLYNGNGGTQSITNTVSGTSFQPDFVWIKTRSASSYHQLVDSVRGVSKVINSNWDGGQSTYTGFSVTAFNSNGVTLVDDAAASYGVNGSTGSPTYVAWQWKKGASSGFDVVSQTLATTGINTITHSLNAVPTMVLAKKTSGTEQWLVYQSSGTTQSQYLGLNTTAAVATSGNLWGSSAFTSSQIYFNGTSGNTYVFYIFAPVAGYSAFGSYTGNGSTDGPFVFTNFRPRYVMVKRTDAVGDWYVFDTGRDPYNATALGLLPNTSQADGNYTGWGDILSNGFKIRRTDGAWNASGGTYIYACFAENAFKNSLAR